MPRVKPSSAAELQAVPVLVKPTPSTVKQEVVSSFKIAIDSQVCRQRQALVVAALLAVTS